MRNVLLVLIALSLFLFPVDSQAQDRVGKFVRVGVDWHLGPMWLNTDHIHRIMPCFAPGFAYKDPDTPIKACIQMAEHSAGSRHREYRTDELYAPAVRHVLNLPNPTTPSGSISGPTTVVAGSQITLTASVVDPDFGDSWTYSWAESSATRNGGSFSEPVGMVTDYTPAMAGTVVIWFQITDSAGQRSSSISHQIAVSAAD